MDKTAPRNPLPVIRLRQSELDDIFALFATLQELEAAKNDMRERFRAIPNGYRDVRLVEVTLNRLLVDLVATIPQEKLRSIRKMLPNMKYKVYFNGTVSQMCDNATAIDSNDLDVLCRLAHDNCCLLCDDDCSKCKCGLSRVFNHVLKMDRQPGDSWSFMDFTKEEK